MLATVHREGVQLWGGLSWMRLRKFPHPLVLFIDFSPNERYLVTMSKEPISLSRGTQTPFTEEDEGNHIAVWNMKSGDLLRTFPAPTSADDGETTGKKPHMIWPTLKWSSDDHYVARVTPGQQISVYELPGMGLLDKKSIKIDGVVDFEWCPYSDQDLVDAEKAAKGDGATKGKKTLKENLLAYWTPEVQDQPARVSVMAIPSRTMLRAKNLYNVKEVRVQRDGADRPFCQMFRQSLITWDRSANSIGRIKETSFASKWTGTRRPKSQFSVIWKSSGSGRRTSLWRSSNSKVRVYLA